MTKQEIQALIASKIAGQGDQVDISGKLPEILTGLSERMSETATITVQIHSFKVNEAEDGWEDDIEGIEGTLYVKGFDVFGSPIEAQEIPFVGQSGATTIDISIDTHIGDTIGVTAKIPGKGASCQLVTKVIEDGILEPEVYPAGIYELGDGAINLTPGEDMYNGTVIVTEDFALLWPARQRENFDSVILPWGPIGQIIPEVLVTNNSSAAIKDYDGAFNTAAILSVISGASAAQVASTPTPGAQYNATGFFLASAGMLKYLYEHRTEINAFIATETEAYTPDDDYQLIPMSNAYWSSTLYSKAVVAWYVNLGNGNVYSDNRNSNDYALAVSAFQTLY